MTRETGRTISVLGVAYAAVLAVGSWIRLARLGWPPLTDVEAARALAAAAGTPTPSAFWPSLPPTDPGYSALTSMLLQALGSKDFVVRVVPALAGIGVLLIPWLLRKRIGSGASLVAAILLAFSPTMLAASRTAGGSPLAVLGLFLALAVFFLDNKGSPTRWPWAAMAVGVGLAAGPSALTGLIGLTLGIAAAMAVLRRQGVREGRPSPAALRLPQTVLLALAAAVAVSVGLGAYPLGLAGLGDEIGAWLTGWTTQGSFSPWTILAGLVIYEPLALVAGVTCVVLAFRKREALPVGLGILVAILAALILVYPSRSPDDLQWLLIPLALLAGMAISRLLESLRWAESRVTVAALSAVLFILLSFAYLQLATFARGLSPDMNLDPSLRLWLVAASLGLGVFVCILFGLGWSWRMAGQSAALALGVAALATTVSFAWDASLGASAATARQLWRPSATTPEAGALVSTLHGVSQAKTGRISALPLLVEGSPSASLAWLLREFPSVSGTSADEQPAVILAPAGAQNPSLAADYVGQTIRLRETRGWTGALPPDILAWWVTRQAPTTVDGWLLLVRADLASFGDLPAQSVQPASP